MSTSLYKMTLSLNVLNHLGLSLYSNIPSVLSEVVANSYDADAENVEIMITNDRIIIKDDGNGMSIDDINSKYLLVGYQKRRQGESFSPKFSRPVMGRKGIGKLSLFSIANSIEIHSIKDGQVQSFEMKKDDIITQINDNEGVYHPKQIDSLAIAKGTTIIISDLKNRSFYAKSLKKRLARRFTVIGEKHNFQVIINDDPISLKDRDFFEKIQFLWTIGLDNTDFVDYANIRKITPLPNSLVIAGKTVSISGWIGTVEYPSNLLDDGVNNNKISILCRGKLAQEDILGSYTEGGIYADYLIGEIVADFLDDNDQEDIATSSRQSINEDDFRFIEVRKLIYQYLKTIQNSWTELRNEKSTERILKEYPTVKKWYDELPADQHRDQAKKLFKTIDTLHFDSENKEVKRTLVKQAVLAFEQFKIRDSLNKIDQITNANELELVSIFSQFNEMEAALYYDIASGRVKIIRELKEKMGKNDLEAVLQKHIFDNLWLLNPSWERATKASEHMEMRIGTKFKEVEDSLTKEQRDSRIDIGYRTSAGKHIIVELKRYKPSYKVTPFVLAEQVDKYTRALKTCLEASGVESPYIEVICVIGEYASGYTRENFNDHLKPYNGRVYPYDQLIEGLFRVIAIILTGSKP